jgi:DNA-directed RNA polymerase specialized sigma24 family protein
MANLTENYTCNRSLKSWIKRMNSCEGEAQARSMTDTVARRSYGKLVAFLASRTRDVAAAEDALSDSSQKLWHERQNSPVAPQFASS